MNAKEARKLGEDVLSTRVAKQLVAIRAQVEMAAKDGRFETTNDGELYLDTITVLERDGFKISFGKRRVYTDESKSTYTISW